MHVRRVPPSGNATLALLLCECFQYVRLPIGRRNSTCSTFLDARKALRNGISKPQYKKKKKENDNTEEYVHSEKGVSARRCCYSHIFYPLDERPAEIRFPAETDIHVSSLTSAILRELHFSLLGNLSRSAQRTGQVRFRTP